jgi:hypothetical protein
MMLPRRKATILADEKRMVKFKQYRILSVRRFSKKGVMVNESQFEGAREEDYLSWECVYDLDLYYIVTSPCIV